MRTRNVALLVTIGVVGTAAVLFGARPALAAIQAVAAVVIASPEVAATVEPTADPTVILTVIPTPEPSFGGGVETTPGPTGLDLHAGMVPVTDPNGQVHMECPLHNANDPSCGPAPVEAVCVDTQTAVPGPPFGCQDPPSVFGCPGAIHYLNGYMVLPFCAGPVKPSPSATPAPTPEPTVAPTVVPTSVPTPTPDPSPTP